MVLADYVPIFLASVGGLIWLIRLEGKLISLERDHERLVDTSTKTDILFQNKIDTLLSDIHKIQGSLIRIETRLSLHHEEKKEH